jgi:hypothetical protein
MVAFISTSTSLKIAMLYQDKDLETLSRDQLINEVKKLRAGIRKHRDSTGHELCWHHPDLWALLPEKIDDRNGRNLWRVVSIIADRWMTKNQKRPV